MNTVTAHEQLVMLGLELVVIFGMATVADASPGWGPIMVMLLVLLWGVFLFSHAEQFVGLFGGGTGAPAGTGGSFVP